MKREEIKLRNRSRSAIFKGIEKFAKENNFGYTLSINNTHANESEEDKKLRELLYEQNRITKHIDKWELPDDLRWKTDK